MIEKMSASLLLLVVLGSCDSKEGQVPQNSSSENLRKTTRSDRSSRSVPSRRDKLRAAFETAKGMEPGEERNTALVEVATNALELASDITVEVIHELPAGFEGKQAVIEAYLKILMTDEKTDEALVWADSLLDKRDILFARGQVSLMLVEKYPEQAAELLPLSGFSADGVDPTAEQVIHSWAAKKPDDAVAWTTRLPAGEARTAGFKVIFTQWLGDDSPTALSWAASQTNPHVRREAVNAMVGAFNDIPDVIRNNIIESADPALRAEIEKGIAEVARQAQDVQAAQPQPQPQPESLPQSEGDPESQSEPPPEAE